jgi:hypothetical protein
MKEDQIRELFREMGDEPVPPESLRRVRLAVAERTRPRIRARWWSAAVLAASACVLLILWLREPAPVKRPAPSVVAREQQVVPPIQRPPLRAPARRKPQPSTRAVARHERPVKRIPAAGTNFVIRIETPDPDVVILLIGD